MRSPFFLFKYTHIRYFISKSTEHYTSFKFTFCNKRYQYMHYLYNFIMDGIWISGINMWQSLNIDHHHSEPKCIVVMKWQMTTKGWTQPIHHDNKLIIQIYVFLHCIIKIPASPSPNIQKTQFWSHPVEPVPPHTTLKKIKWLFAHF